jgi:hypothetical protein
MCGIAGILNRDAAIADSLVHTMLDQIGNRGPDDRLNIPVKIPILRICFDGRKINLSRVFAEQDIGIREVSDILLKRT